MRRSPWLTDDPVAVQFVVDLPAHWILSQKAPHKAYGGNDSEENYAQDDSGVNPAKDMSEKHPAFVNPK